MTRKLIALLAGAGLVLDAAAFDLGSIDLNKVGDIISKSSDAVTEIDEPREVEIGQGVASSLLGVAPLVDNKALQRYVNDVGLWLALQTERPDLSWHFGVIDTDTINAFAAPGGYVFITRGLFQSLRNEAELAGVLAHEITHVLHRHHLNAIQHNARTGILADVASMAAKQKGHDLNGLIGTGMELYARGLDKGDEFDADLTGVVIATRAGYNPRGLVDVLLTLENMNADDDALTLMFKTHPPAGDRRQKLQAGMAGKLDGYDSQPWIAPRMQKMLARME